jgi:flagellar motor switch protein FliN/FliY
MTEIDFAEIDRIEESIKSRAAAQSPGAQPETGAQAQLGAGPDFGALAGAAQTGAVDPRRLDAIMRIPVVVQVVVGSATLPVSTLMKLGRGAIVPLDHRIGDPVDVVVNGRVIARGEVVVVEDDNTRFGVSLTEIRGPQSGDRPE